MLYCVNKVHRQEVSITMAQQTVNIHSEAIDKKIQKIRKGDKYEVPSRSVFSRIYHTNFLRLYIHEPGSRHVLTHIYEEISV